MLASRCVGFLTGEACAAPACRRDSRAAVSQKPAAATPERTSAKPAHKGDGRRINRKTSDKSAKPTAEIREVRQAGARQRHKSATKFRRKSRKNPASRRISRIKPRNATDASLRQGCAWAEVAGGANPAGHFNVVDSSLRRHRRRGGPDVPQKAAGIHAVDNAAAPLAVASPTPPPVRPRTTLAHGSNVKYLAARRRRGQASHRAWCTRAELDEATSVESTISDPVARKLVEWAILRSDSADLDFPRYAAFIAANPSWPSISALRRRAEAALWQQQADRRAVIEFFRNDPPRTAKGRFALARALLGEGDPAGAQAAVRDAWRKDSFSADLETQARDMFAGLITPADDKARMDARFDVEDDDAGMRAARHLGAVEIAIGKARTAVINKSSKAKASAGRSPCGGPARSRLCLQPRPMAAPQPTRSRKRDSGWPARRTKRNGSAMSISGGSSGG